jgi:hypothetical protein
MFQSMVQKIKGRHVASMKRRTERLDAPTLDLLSDYLHDQMVVVTPSDPRDVLEVEETTTNDEVDNDSVVVVMSTAEQVQLLQEELDQLQSRLSLSIEKEQFIGTRLRSYQLKLQHYQYQQQQQQQQRQKENKIDAPITQDVLVTNNFENEVTASATGSTPPEPPQQPSSGSTHNEEEEYRKQRQLLEQIEMSHKTFQKAIQVLQERIQHLEGKQAQLQQNTDECQVVYETAQALRRQQQQQPLPLTTAEDKDPERGEGDPCSHVVIGDELLDRPPPDAPPITPPTTGTDTDIPTSTVTIPQ